MVLETKSAKSITVKNIIELEWEMFIAVNEGGERASCQEDPVTFEGMRAAQFNAWSDDAACSYLSDLEKAKNDERNLIEEKYIHMSKTTEPRRYVLLLNRVTLPTEEASALAHEISDTLLEQTRVLFEDYPYVAGQGRPLSSSLDYAGTSVETYQLSELLTYSDGTLSKLREHVMALKSGGKSLAMLILENTVRFYGYASLDSAEAAARAYAEKQGIEISFGCASCDCSGDCDCDGDENQHGVLLNNSDGNRYVTLFENSDENGDGNTTTVTDRSSDESINGSSCGDCENYAV